MLLSNHGGRQLDRAPVPFHLLPDVVAAVGDSVEVHVDTGIMSGQDVVAAIAHGATFTLVGRAYLYGLMAGGRAGVDRAIEILRDQVERTMRLLGVATLDELEPGHVTQLVRLGPRRAVSAGDGRARRRPGRPGGGLRQLALVSVVQVMAVATWFAASAAAPALRDGVGDRSGRRGAADDRRPARLRHRRAGLGGHQPPRPGRPAAADGARRGGRGTRDPRHGHRGRRSPRRCAALVTGTALALVYPVGMKLVVSWFADRRGLAVSIMVGSLTLGSILPQLISGSLGAAWRTALLVSSGLSMVAAVLQRWIRVGPLVAPSQGFRPGAALDVWRARAPRLANLGYLGHMWELYAVWAWAPAFLAASLAARGEPASRGTVGLVAFVAFGLCGALGCFVAGWLGDRVGRARAATGAMLVSGACCLLAAIAYGGPAVAAGAAAHGLGRVGDRRLGDVLGLPRDGRRPALRRHRADPPDRLRLPADRRHDPAGAGRRGCGRLAGWPWRCCRSDRCWGRSRWCG